MKLNNFFKKIAVFVFVFSVILTNFAGGFKSDIAHASAPTANNDSFTIAEGSAVTRAVSGIGDSLTFALVSGPGYGSLVFNSDGSYIYSAHRQPTIGFISGDSFTFKANDGANDSNIATVTITITPVNDVPFAQDSSFTINQGDQHSGSVTATDVDGDALTYALVSGPSKGSLTFNSSGSFDYSANSGQAGEDSFTFRVNDGLADSNIGTVSITIVGPTSYTLTYTAGAGGSISGDTNQTVNEGEDGAVVSAVADSGYLFISWSDDSTDNPRTDINISDNISVSAIFEELPPSRSSAPVSLPPGLGTGARDSGAIGALSIGQSIYVGEVDNSGVNVLTYVSNTNNFLAPQSSSNWQLNNRSFKITNLDLFHNKAEIIFYSQSRVFNLNLGESKEVDLDGDGIFDIVITFSGLYVNRAEITIKSLSGLDREINKEEKEEDKSIDYSSVDYSSVIKKEKELAGEINNSLVNRLTSNILLQVEEGGQAWYLDPASKQRYFMGRPYDSFNMMRRFGLGVSEDNFSKFEKLGVPSRFAGRILLRTEANGEAYYINPIDMEMHYLGRPINAFNLMRTLALGISNYDIRQILVGEFK